MVKIIQKLVSSSKYSIKCPYQMTPEYITVHNTANDASAENEIAYMNNNNIVLLNVFMKQKTKTPQKEILKAKKYLKDFIKRSDKNEQ